MSINDFDDINDIDEEPVVKKKKVLYKRQPQKEKEDEVDLFDETETNSDERNKFLSFDDDEEDEVSEPSVSEEESEEEEHDDLDDVIPFMESIEDGIYHAKITSVKSTKNDKVMISFSVKVEEQFYYSLFCFFEKYALKGNLTYRLLNAFNNKNLSFKKLLNRTVFISVRVNHKDGKTYENILDFVNSKDYDIDDLEVDKYGRFIF